MCIYTYHFDPVLSVPLSAYYLWKQNGKSTKLLLDYYQFFGSIGIILSIPKLKCPQNTQRYMAVVRLIFSTRFFDRFRVRVRFSVRSQAEVKNQKG